MKILCIDVGNTSTHYGIVEEQTVLESGDFATTQLRPESPELFPTALSALLPKVDGVSLCSVVPEVTQWLLNRIEPENHTVYHLTHLNCHGLKLAYPKPEEIGQDRLANAIAAQEYHGVPAIILDMGTAVTLDVVSGDGYEGGIIAPGLAVMTRYLHEQTALLPKLEEDDLVRVDGTIGKSTVHAMQLGVTIGFSGMLDALLKRVLAELKTREGAQPVVLCTGGSIANLTREWAQKSHFVKDLTLIGLAAAFRRNHN